MILKKQLQAYFLVHADEWVASGTLQRMTYKNAKGGSIYTPQNVGRTLRKLEQMKLLAVSYNGEKQSAQYKYLPTYLRPYYLTSSERIAKGTDNLFTLPPEEVRALRAQFRSQGYVA